jgi:hypothetical protein
MRQTGTEPCNWCRGISRESGTVVANFSPRRGVHMEADAIGSAGANVFSCDYNGWADVPEEEREGIDAFEAALLPPAPAPVPLITRLSPLPATPLPRRKAA